MTRFEFAKIEIPRLIDQRLKELRKKDSSAKYEAALHEIGREHPDLWEDYTRYVASDAGL